VRANGADFCDERGGVKNRGTRIQSGTLYVAENNDDRLNKSGKRHNADGLFTPQSQVVRSAQSSFNCNMVQHVCGGGNNHNMNGDEAK
jgi:hypothetical protein